MCDQTEIEYLDGDVVWVKLGSCWWPGEVVGPNRLPPDVLPSFRKPPIAVVKFFQETTYEYVKNINSIYKYNCSRKNEFINKGLYMYRTKHGHMEKFPEDVIRAETAVGGDIEILTRDEFQEVKKQSYAGIFGDTPKKTPVSGNKGKGRRRQTSESFKLSTPISKSFMEKSDYKAHILVQAVTPIRQSTETRSTPSTSRAGSEAAEDKVEKVEKVQPPTTPATPTISSLSSGGTYSCHSCPFTTARLNVLILHYKTHSSGFVPYTPSPVRKKVSPKSPTKTTTKTPQTTKSPKTSRPRKEISEKTTKTSAKKRSAEEKPKNVEEKKPKTEQEIKSSLLADWDDVDEESADESALPPARSPEVPVGAESPAAPTPAELPSAHVPIESTSSFEREPDEPPAEKPESSSDSKYEFCEDEDWPVEADVGRKIPRIKPSKRRDEAKSISLDDEDVAKEVAALLNKTTVPELPSIPEPLKAEENFPEPPVIKSPDKKPEITVEAKSSENTAETKPTKAIFKTKTFFRSRHSRSQDAIGKYVAEQLNAAERMDLNDIEINGSEPVSSPETRDSSPVEPVKVARLAPKIQLKKMKAEAAQLEEKEKNAMDQLDKSMKIIKQKSEHKMNDTDKILQDALYPAQVIKPVSIEIPSKLLKEDIKEHCKRTEDMNEGQTEVIVAESGMDTQIMSQKNFTSTKVIEETPKPVKNVESVPLINATDENLAFVKISLCDSKEIELRKESEHVSKMFVPMEVDHDQANTEKLINASPTHSKVSPTISEFRKESDHVAKMSVLMEVDHDQVNTETLIRTSPKHSKVSPTISELRKESEHVSKMSVLMEVDNDQVNTEALNKSSPKHSKVSPSISELRKESEHVSKMSDLMEVNHDQVNTETLIKTSPKHSKVSSTISPKNSPKSSPLKSLIATESSLASKLDTVKSFEELNEPYMSESTASAVDALLSVSREADRVTRIVSDDVPEDLFEDDNKDGTNNECIISETSCTDSRGFVDCDVGQEKPLAENIDKNLNGQKESSDDFKELVFTEISKISTSKSDIILSDNLVSASISENVPSESDLQIAEALINLPSTTMQNKPCELQDNLDIRTFNSDMFVEEQVVATTETHIEPIKDQKSIESETELTSHHKEFSNVRYETEQEQSENLNAAQSLVQMSEFIDPKVNARECNEAVITESPKIEVFKTKQNNGVDVKNTVEQNVALLASENKSDSCSKIPKFETTSSKLLKILEEPPAPKPPVNKPATPVKQVVVTGKEKILNFDVAKAPKGPAPKQKIIIRRSATSKTIINNLKDVITSPDKIILSRNTVQDGSSIQTFTIQTTPDSTVSTITTTDPKQIIIQPKLRKLTKPNNKVQKIKSQNSLISDMSEPKRLNEVPVVEEPMFDINSMPVVLSDDILTPESIEKMPIVMSDGNIITNTPNPPKLVKTKPVVENEKIVTMANEKIVTMANEKIVTMANEKKLTMANEKIVTTANEKIVTMANEKIVTMANEKIVTMANEKIITMANEKIIKCVSSPKKTEVKTLIMNPISDVNKVTTPNILSKSSKLRGAKPMLVIDKATGKQKIIMTKGEPVVKEIKQAPSLVQAVPQAVPKAEKFILLPSAPSPRPGRTQKIVIDPQTGKAHVLVTKGQETPLPVPDNKPVSAKLIPSSSDASNPGNTVMIITNAQGAQSRIVLTPEHEKILFPNKQPNVSQLKTITHRIATSSVVAQKNVATTAAPVKTQSKIVSKQKSAIITSKGQLIVGGRVATTSQNIAPTPEIRPTTTKRIIATEPKKLIQAVQKNASEPLIFLQQKSGAVMQLTAAQFEHLQRTGQIVQKVPAPIQENKIVVQKSITIQPKETITPVIQKKQRVRKTVGEAAVPAKRAKKEMVISATTVARPAPVLPPAIAVPPVPATPTPVPLAPPPLAPLVSSVPTITITPMVPDVSNTVSINTSSAYPDLDNFEELLPSTAIVRQPEPAPPPEPPAPPQPAPQVCPEVPAAVGGYSGYDPAAAAIAENQLLAVPGENLGGLPGSFYLCIEENGKFTPIDNRPLILENNQLVPMAVEPVPQPERRDILEAALANSDVFQAEAPRDEAPDFRDLNANVSVHCRVSETSTTLHQPIMTPVEVPTKGEGEPVPASLEDGLAVIGVTPHAVPTSLELPITVTDPRIAPRATADPLNYGTTQLLPSPSAEMFVASEEVEAGMSMPLLAEQEAVGKSMPLLTDEVAVSSVESAESGGSPDARCEDGGARWSRRLLTPASDTSDNSAEIPLQPALQLSVADLAPTHS